MEFLIIFGGILSMIGICIRPHIQWDVDPNACNLENEYKVVKANRRGFYTLIIGGPTLIILGILGMIFL